MRTFLFLSTRFRFRFPFRSHEQHFIVVGDTIGVMTGVVTAIIITPQRQNSGPTTVTRFAPDLEALGVKKANSVLAELLKPVAISSPVQVIVG